MSGPYNDFPPFEASSETSYLAAEGVADSAETQRERVYSYMIWCGTFGATDDQMQRALGMGGNTQRPRRRELELVGRVAKTDQRRLTSSGSKANVYVAVAPQAVLVPEPPVVLQQASLLGKDEDQEEW